MTDNAELPKRERDKLARMEVAFEKIDKLLYRIGLQGLQRVSEASATELQALKQTAHNAALITVERQLDILATQVQRYLERDPLFRMSDYMATINRIWLLNQQARRMHSKGLSPAEMVDIIGETRRSYEEREEPLMLQPLGASGWVSDTDFVGVTIYFYADVEGAPIYQASNAKPTMYFGNDPRRLLHDQISDYVQFSIHDMAHGAFEFSRARISRDGRLSLHKDLQVKKAPYIGARAYKALACDDWQELVERIKNSEVNPVYSSGSSFVLISPAEMGPVFMDEKNARVWAEISDRRGATLQLEVPLRAENNFLIDNLEFILGADQPSKGKEQASKRGKRRKVADGAPRQAPAALKPNALFGKAWLGEGKLKFFPYTGVYNQAVVLNERGKKRVNEIHLSLEDMHFVSARE